MTLMQLEVFLKVVETGSFTKAGVSLSLTQSAISHAISALESELQIPILIRDRKNIRMTEAGENLLFHARGIMNHLEQIHQYSASLLGHEMGTVKIGSFPSFLAKQLPCILREFQTSYPGLNLQIYEGDYEEVLSWLKEGKIEVGFSVTPGDTLECTALMEDQLLGVVARNHSLAEKSELSREDIQDLTFIKDVGCNRYLQEWFGSSPLPPHTQFEIADTQSILAMVEAGLGITIFPEMSLPEESQVQTINLTPRLTREIGIFFRSRQTLSPATLLFVHYVEEWFNIV